MARMFPRTLREVVERAAKPINRKRGFAETAILRQWPSIVGESLASQTQPLRMSFTRGETTNGQLTIACTPAFAPELQQLIPIMLDKIAVHLGYRAISRIQIEQHHMAHIRSPKKEATKSPIGADEVFSDDPLENALRRLEKMRKLRDDNNNNPK